MGKKWFSAVKKIFGSESKENHKIEKPMKRGPKSSNSRKSGSDACEDSAFDSSPLNKPLLPASPPPKQASNDSEDGENQHSYLMAMAAAEAAEAAAAIARAEEEVARLITSSTGFIDDGSRKEVAAIKIQAAFRGFLARRGTACLRGMVRLKLMINRNAVKRQTVNTLHSIQALARIQSQVRERRIRLSEENQSLHRQRQLKREKELQKSKTGEDWVDSPKSKEQFEANLQKQQEAALRRERTLAYAYSHQWRTKSTRYKSQPFVDQTNPQWGWNWLERWMATRPWETNRSIIDRDRPGDLSPIKSGGQSITGGRRSSTRSRQSPSTPPSAATKDDISSLHGFQSKQNRRRRHSFGSSFCFKEEEAARAKSRFQALDAGKSDVINGRSLTRKHLSFSVYGEDKQLPPTPVASRRLSGSSKVMAA